MQIEPKGLSERYLIQMSNRDSLPEGMLQSHSCRFNAQNVTDDITVYIWRDGVFSGVSDGLPDGYTVTTGTISDPETVGSPPKVTPGFAQGLVCSNVSIDGASCPGGKKQKNALCHALGKVPMKFTMHMEYQ
ncbi:MAG: hypothetical protein EX260_10085 [Desulfobulbaceae bacterium]|nr:MAG: hypothetical protein EX260_10085 [Desulfobulbaceae bacterium]